MAAQYAIYLGRLPSTITQTHEGANQIERVVLAAAAERLMYGW